jgi:hypothetical protein
MVAAPAEAQDLVLEEVAAEVRGLVRDRGRDLGRVAAMAEDPET